MKINEKLNLVVPIERDDGRTIYAHSTPISKEVFETNFLVISKTFAAIYGEGLSFVAGPRIAAMMLKRIANDMGIWDEVRTGLVEEIHRLTLFLIPGDRGVETVPYHEVVTRKLLDDEDLAEVDGVITFFIVASAMHKRSEVRGVMDWVAKAWGSELSSLNSTAYADSLKTSTAPESSGETATTSSLPR